MSIVAIDPSPGATDIAGSRIPPRTSFKSAISHQLLEEADIGELGPAVVQRGAAAATYRADSTRFDAFGTDLFRTLAEDHQFVLYGLASKHAPNHADAQDLVQDAFERALRKRPPVRNRIELQRWLMVVLRNLFIDRCRAPERRRASVDIDCLPAPRVTESEPAWSTLTLETVVRALPQLNETLRAVFSLHIEGASVPRIASHLGISTAQVSARLFRARRRLRTVLSKSALQSRISRG